MDAVTSCDFVMLNRLLVSKLRAFPNQLEHFHSHAGGLLECLLDLHDLVRRLEVEVLIGSRKSLPR